MFPMHGRRQSCCPMRPVVFIPFAGALALLLLCVVFPAARAAPAAVADRQGPLPPPPTQPAPSRAPRGPNVFLAETQSTASAAAQRAQTNFTLVAQTADVAKAGKGQSCPQTISYLYIGQYIGFNPQNRNVTVDAALYRNILVNGAACADSSAPTTATTFVQLQETDPGDVAKVTNPQPFFLRGTDNSARVCGSYSPDYPYFYYFTDQMARFQDILVSMGLIPANNSGLLAAKASDIYMMAQPYLGGQTDGSLVSTAVCTYKAPSLFVNASTSPSPSPSPSSKNEGSSRKCFPGSSVVTALRDGRPVPLRMAQLGLHTRVLVHPTKRGDDTSNEDGSSSPVDEFSDVYLFTHRLPKMYAPYLVLSTAENASLTLSAGHYVYTHPRGMLPAQEVVAGRDSLLRAHGGHALVTGVRTVVRQGVYAPHTLDGRIVVDGFLASTYTTACPPSLAHFLLAPLRLLYRVSGWTAWEALDRGIDAPLLRPVQYVLNTVDTVYRKFDGLLDSEVCHDSCIGKP